MKNPSIDRIDNTKNYTLDNCRFMELEDNLARTEQSITMTIEKNKMLEDMNKRLEGVVAKLNKTLIFTMGRNEALEAELATLQAKNKELEKCEHEGCEETDIIRVCHNHINTDYPPVNQEKEG